MLNLYNNASRDDAIRRALVFAQKGAHVHGDPERRALSQPRGDLVRIERRAARLARLAHHAGAHDELNVNRIEVRWRVHTATSSYADVV